MDAHVGSLRRQCSGVSLLEALVAMVLMAGGLVGLLAMQMTLARSADIAKQKGEAVRLAQQQIESMRSFTTLVATPGHLAWTDLGAGNDAVSSNTTFTRTWTLSGSADDALREVSVSLAWQDRAGTEQRLTLQSVISKTDPADVGALGFPLPANTTLKRPKNRNLNIPVPAKELGGGKSVYQLSSNFAVVFNNDSGYVVRKCNKTINNEADMDEGCVDYAAMILAGYISMSSGSFPSARASTPPG